ncbi:hypothetical protein KIN20_014300 [Parelaphostrongylus tenuis]|uniref:Uncharacterized protein n=1 Tax=Parelaphostrongylus tenuis TaxID=148309 RepID=A0AAD5MER5_PARTN|nr:hypothetical protein KIN20_014300 [Parelaphostrongylus tenuis]
MKVEKSDLPDDSSSSLHSFNDASSVLHDNETSEAIDESEGGDESSTGDDVGSSTAMKNRSYYHLKPSARQFMGGVRTIELVASKCYISDSAFDAQLGEHGKGSTTSAPDFLADYRCSAMMWITSRLPQ